MPSLQNIQNIQSPEMVAWVQTIVAPMIQEQIEATRRHIRQDELRRLERSFTEGQKRTESRLDRLEAVVVELAEAQKRTETRVEELAEAQKRTENQLNRLEAVVVELVEAQKRTEARIDDLNHRVGLISNILGVEIEGDAEDILVYVLEQKGYQLLKAPYSLSVDDTEIDIVIEAKMPNGKQVSILVEVKTRARLKELRRWAGRLRNSKFQQQLVEAGVTGPFLPYFFGMRVYQVVDDAARDLGIGVLDPNGERVAPVILE